VNRCLVLGCGPSLADIPNTFLDKYPTFGGNRVYLKYTPTYYVSVDESNMTEHVDEINALDSKVKYISRRWAHLVDGAIPLNSSSAQRFSYEPLRILKEGYSVTFVMLQLAYWHGFEEVGLLGVDHRYTIPGEPGEPYTGVDNDHFTPDYYHNQSTRPVPILSLPEKYFNMAKQAYQENGRRVVNLTPNTALTVFDCEDWQTW